MANSQLHKQQRLAGHAHRTRCAPSEPERALWAALRASQLGVQFRRQVVLQGYIVDFFAPDARLVVEVDGAHHALRRGADKRRDRALAALGLRVLRLPASLVTGNLAHALEVVLRTLRLATPSPLRERGGVARARREA